MARERPAIGGIRTARRVFHPTPTGASDARRYTGEVLGAWGVPAPDDAVLVAAELASNAVRHARSVFVLTLHWQDDLVHVAVQDRDPAPPHSGALTSGATSGRGLLIVRELSSSWGWTPVRGGKTIWATVRVPELACPVTCVPPAIA